MPASTLGTDRGSHADCRTQEDTLFSHAPADRPSPSDAALGDPALDARWRAATAGWRPSSIRSGDADRTWAWVRFAWETLVAALDDDAPVAEAVSGGPAAGPDRRVRDLLTVAALFVLQERFLAVAAGEPDEPEIPDPRADGAPLGDAETVAVVGEQWDLDPEGSDGFAAEVSGFLQDHLDELAADVRELLADRRGSTRLFAELWSIDHGDELDPEPDEERARPFPLSTDDIAWIVSGVPGPQKHTAWEWLTR